MHLGTVFMVRNTVLNFQVDRFSTFWTYLDFPCFSIMTWNCQFWAKIWRFWEQIGVKR